MVVVGAGVVVVVEMVFGGNVVVVVVVVVVGDVVVVEMVDGVVKILGQALLLVIVVGKLTVCNTGLNCSQW